MGMKPSYEKLIGQILVALEVVCGGLGCRINCFAAKRQGSFSTGRGDIRASGREASHR